VSSGGLGTRTYDSVAVGDELERLVLPSPHLIVAGRSPAATTKTSTTTAPRTAARSPDIFMNILTTNGLVGRFVTDWSGPLRCCATW